MIDVWVLCICCFCSYVFGGLVAYRKGRRVSLRLYVETMVFLNQLLEKNESEAAGIFLRKVLNKHT